MPLKTKDKGDGPVKKAAKGKKVKDVDGGGRGDTRAEDEVSEKLQELEERARAAFLGFARTDLFKRNLTFGKYNPRQLSDTPLQQESNGPTFMKIGGAIVEICAEQVAVSSPFIVA
ncbi:hypothetical protein EV363DRAFT_1297410 [Boletus edulis]|nr:hypothetical protein EV363DRAFT_1297410 [Boletus edulis]